MDPEANLRAQRDVAAAVMKLWDSAGDDGSFTAAQTAALVHHAYRLAELVQALDGWILGGGFLPAPWKQPDTQLSEFLDDVVDYLDDRQDVNDGEDGQPVPNTAMRLLHTAEILQARYDPTPEADT